MYKKMILTSTIGMEYFDKKINKENEEAIENIEKHLLESNKINKKLLIIFRKCFFYFMKITFLRKIFLFIISFHPKVKNYIKRCCLYKEKKIENEEKRTKYCKKV